MKTQPLVDFSLYDPTIKPDSTLTTADAQAFSKIADLEIPNSFELIATFEPDAWLLDGSRELLPAVTTNVHVGWFNAVLSDASGNFATGRTMNVNFSVDQTIAGLTLGFSDVLGEWATDVDVVYLDSGSTPLLTVTYNPTSAEFYAVVGVAGVRQITLSFNSVNKPYRFLKLKSIDYGKVIHFDGADIKSCTVVEQIDPLSTTLPIGTLELTIHSDDANFDITDPAGDFADLENRQPLDVYEQVGGSQIFIGEFFLDDWETPSLNEIKFRAVDLIGVLDTLPYSGWWDDNFTETVTDVADTILTPNGIPYAVEATLDTSDYEMIGWIPRGTCREALHKLLMAAGATAVCARLNYINIKRIPLPPCSPTPTYQPVLTTWDYALTAAEKGAEQSLTLRPLVTGAEVVGWDVWELIASPSDLFNGTLSAGTYTILFDHPVSTVGLSVTGATADVVDHNYVTITVAVTGSVVVTSTYYEIRKTNRGTYNAVAATVKPNLVRVEDNPMLMRTNGWGTSANVETTRLLSYFNQRYVQKMKMYAPALKVGDSALIDSYSGRKIWAVVHKMTLDLSGGFVAQVEAVGVVKT